MPASDIYELAIQGSLQGQQVVTTHHFRQLVADAALGYTPDPEVDLQRSWQDHGHGEWMAMMPSASGATGGYTLDQLTIRRVVPYGQPTPAAQLFPYSDVGLRGGGGDSEPPFVVAHCSVRTALAGRRYRGRFFVSGLLDTDHHGEALVGGDTTFLSHLLEYCGGTGLGAFLPGGVSTDWRIGVWSRRLAGYPAPNRKSGAPATPIAPPSAAVAAFTDAVGLTPRPLISSLRSRHS
jgi:hypothetical protein